ncbi:TonB-dependent receptor [Aquidulcibacter paucihalophilus]|jgi:iron complex outermembrane receptor protein|nr:TonB-dependent receptor [Aquidulcibacter paucihalophilus]
MRSFLLATSLLTLPGAALAQSAVLEPTQLDEVVVTATRSEQSILDVPAAISSQNLDELRQQGFTYGTDEFRGVPGVYFRRGEGDGDEFPFVSIRGVTGNHGNDTFLALIDGIPFVGPDEEVMLYQVPYGAVERVEVVRGPVSALYGRGAIAGAVNYITRNPREDGLEISVSAGSDDYYRAEALVESAGDRASFVGSVSYETSEGWREQSARENLNLFGKARFDLSSSTTLSLYANYLDRAGDVPGAIPTLADGTVPDGIDREVFLGYGDTHNDFQGHMGAVRLDHTASDELSFSVTAHARRFDTDVFLNFYDPFGFNPPANIMAVNGYASHGESGTAFGEATARWTPGRHDILVGVSAERTTLDDDERWSGQYGFTFGCGFAFFLIEIDYTTGETLNAGHPCFVQNQVQALTEATNSFWSVFIQDEVELTETLTLTLGGRYDAFDREVTFGATSPFNPGGQAGGDSSAFAPKAALSWRYGPGQVYVAYGRGFNSNFGPTWQWDPSQYARTEEPTTIDNLEIGWKGRALDDRLTFETALFHLVQKNRRVFVTNPDPLGPPTLATTGQRYEVTGFEGAIEFRPTTDTTLNATFTWLDPVWDEFEAGGVDYSGVTPTGVPGQMFAVSAEHRFTPGFRGRVGYEWYADYQISLDNAHEGGGYDLVSLSGVFDISDRVAVDVSATNALDSDYLAFFGNEHDVTHATPGVPRQIRATLRARF